MELRQRAGACRAGLACPRVILRCSVSVSVPVFGMSSGGRGCLDPDGAPGEPGIPASINPNGPQFLCRAIDSRLVKDTLRWL